MYLNVRDDDGDTVQLGVSYFFPSWVQFTGTGKFLLEPTTNEIATSDVAVFQLTDGIHTVGLSFQINVVENNPPVISSPLPSSLSSAIPEVEVVAGVTSTVNLPMDWYTDPEGDQVDYSNI